MTSRGRAEGQARVRREAGSLGVLGQQFGFVLSTGGSHRNVLSRDRSYKMILIAE